MTAHDPIQKHLTNMIFSLRKVNSISVKTLRQDLQKQFFSGCNAAARSVLQILTPYSKAAHSKENYA